MTWLAKRIQGLAHILPARLVYFCAIRVGAEATTGVYGTTVVPELTLMDAIGRFARIHGIPGNGKDEHYDSNRNVNGATNDPSRV